MQKISVRRIVN